MGIFDFENVPKEDILLLTQLAQASYEPNTLPNVPGVAPPGWETLTADDLNYQGNLVDGFFSGDYFIAGAAAYFSAAARVMREGNTVTISFQGTENLVETLLYREIGNTDEYIANFDALLQAVAAYVANDPTVENVWITGHSLGAAAVNELRNISETAYGGAFADALYVSFATPEIFAEDTDILNIGYKNDDVFKSVDAGDFATTTENIIYYNAEYLLPSAAEGQTVLEIAEIALNLLTTHNIPNYLDGIGRIIQSEFYDEMERDSLVVVDDFAGTVRASNLDGFDGAAAFYIGSDDDDGIVAGTNDDKIEGFGGNDWLRGGDGNDEILGGKGNDTLSGQTGDDVLEGGAGDDLIQPGGGADQIVYNFSDPHGIGEDIVQFNARGDTLVFENSPFSEQDIENAISREAGVVRIDLGPDTSITLVGIGVNAFEASDIVFV